MIRGELSSYAHLGLCYKRKNDQMMKTKLFLSMALMVVAIGADAQLYQDASNVTAIGVRDPARQSSTEIDAVINNPAGTAFLKEGLHLSLTGQYTFGEVDYGNYNKTVEGPTKNAIPSLQAAYKKEKFALSLSYGNEGGYGTWLGTEEPILTDVLNNANEQAFGAYRETMSQIVSNCTPYDEAVSGAFTGGHLYNHTFRLGGAYQINNHWGAYLGLRANYYSEKGKVWVNRWIRRANGEFVSPHDYFSAIDDAFMSKSLSTAASAAILAALADQLGVDVSDLVNSTQDLLEATEKVHQLNQKAASTPGQTVLTSGSESARGWGISPVLGVHLQTGQFDLAAKYEFETKIHTNDQVQSFHIPSLLQLGASWQPMQNLKVAIGGAWSHHSKNLLPGQNQRLDLSGKDNFFNLPDTSDSNASLTISDNSNDSWNVSASVTFSPVKSVAISAGYKYGESGYMCRGEFAQSMPVAKNIPTDVFAAGIRYDVTDYILLDLGFSKTICSTPVFSSAGTICFLGHQSTTVAASISLKL